MKIKLASSNLNQTPLNWKRNYRNIKTSINESINNKIEILCLPELATTGYGCQDLFFSNWLIKKSDELLIKISKLCKSITVIIGHPLIFKGKIYNSCCIIRDCKILGFFVKSNLPNDGIHYEKRWFEPWILGKKDEIKFENKKYPIGTIEIKYNKKITLGFEICRDSWDKERPANYIKSNNYLIIFNPIASHYAFKKFEFRRNQVIQSSKNFNCTYMSVNLLGNESGKVIFEGDTILSQKGKLLDISKRFSFKNYLLNCYEIDLVNDKKIFNYKKLNEFEEFINAFSLAIVDYLSKSNSNGYALSLSGGLDSSSIAILIYEMIKRYIIEMGKEKTLKRFNLNKIDFSKNINQNAKNICKKIFFTAYQKTKNSSKLTFKSANNIAKFIGSTHYTWSIDDEIDSIIEKISTQTKVKYNWEKNDIALQNIQARVRSPFIWFIANTNNLLLLSTSNRNESSVGYSTMDGDSSGSIAPIAGVDKIFLRDLLTYLLKKYDYEPISNVLSLKPSAELKPLKFNQQDEKDLMSYRLLSKIERYAVKDKLSPKEIIIKMKGYKKYSNKDLVNSIKIFFTLFGKNQWKRERTAPSFHFDEYSVDSSSWLRMPILSNNFREEIENL